LQFIHDLNVSPFRTGLTAFQMGNNLAILGICLPPTPYEIVEWIDENRGLGAFRGLLRLGFKLSTRETIYVAFMIVYNHLEYFLADDDRTILHFGAMLVEHVLCKVVRWEDRIGEDRMKNICEGAWEANRVWAADANIKNPSRYPFPPYAVSERLDAGRRRWWQATGDALVPWRRLLGRLGILAGDGRNQPGSPRRCPNISIAPDRRSSSISKRLMPE
jgi:hypothetical protein